MKLPISRIIEKVVTTPWMITPGGYAAVKSVLDSKLAGAHLDGGIRDLDGTDIGSVIDNNGIAQIMISGTLGQRLSMIEKICGGVDYQDIEAVTNEAIEEGARGILYQFDSPGGMSTGCPECAVMIASAEVPKVAFTDSMMCSAAYYLASGCDYLVSTDSSEVGSIGVIIPWVDTSQMWELAGAKFDPIVTEGDDLKGAMMGPSLSADQREHFQSMVDNLGAMFRNHVSQYRTLNYSKLKAGSFNGTRAKELNLVDNVGNYADAYKKLTRLVDKREKDNSK